MKKHLIPTLILLFISSISYAQNLVPNGDFEQYSGCPDNEAEIDSALYWTNPTDVGGGGGTSDYLNECSTSSLVSVPENFLGYQQARSGAGYGGVLLYVFGASSYREYIETPLTSPLVAGTCYHFKMYVNLCNNCYFVTDDIGVYFSNTLISGITNDDPLPFIPQINNSAGNIADTLSWSLVSGDYIAVGGESYLVIGNFKNDSNTTTAMANPASIIADYTFIDDVSLIACSATGMDEFAHNDHVTLTPNPATNYFTISIPGNNNKTDIVITDVTGKIIYTTTAADTQKIEMSTLDFAEGIYFVQVRTLGFIETKKLIITK